MTDFETQIVERKEDEPRFCRVCLIKKPLNDFYIRQYRLYLKREDEWKDYSYRACKSCSTKYVKRGNNFQRLTENEKQILRSKIKSVRQISQELRISLSSAYRWIGKLKELTQEQANNA